METIATTGLHELSHNNNEDLPLSVHKVESSDDLLNEILLRLPVISLVLFKSVSKRWLSLIKDDTFIKRRRSLIPNNIDPPSGLFRYVKYDSIEPGVTTDVHAFVPFDIRIPSRAKSIFKTVPSTLLHSCNGLFLCSIRPGHRFCVYNPTLHLFKVLSEPHYYDSQRDNFTRLDFDPTKSPHYKLVHATHFGRHNHLRIQTYSSETSIWSIVCSCRDLKRAPFYCHYRDAIYLNNAIHWILSDYCYSLNLMNETAVLTKIQLPHSNVIYRKLFQSRGCLLHIGKDKTLPDQLHVYEMGNGDFEWSFKYAVNLSRISSSIWHIHQDILCIALGEREEDSFMVIKLVEKVFIYKFLVKTFCELPELDSLSKRCLLYSGGNFLFTASFASV